MRVEVRGVVGLAHCMGRRALARTRQSKPDSCFGFQIEVLKITRCSLFTQIRLGILLVACSDLLLQEVFRYGDVDEFEGGLVPPQGPRGVLPCSPQVTSDLKGKEFRFKTF